MAEPFYFICYSRRDGEDIVLTLADQLAAGPPSISVWLDRRNLQPGIDWDEQIVGALRGCAGVLYVMTKDSVSPNSECKREWTRGLKYNKPIIPLMFHKEAEVPFRLEPRQYVDFTHGFDAGLARLREHVRWCGRAARRRGRGRWDRAAKSATARSTGSGAPGQRRPCHRSAPRTRRWEGEKNAAG